MEQIDICKSFPQERLEGILREIGCDHRDSFLHVTSIDDSIMLPYIKSIRNLETERPRPTSIIYTEGPAEPELRKTIHAKVAKVENPIEFKELFVSVYGAIIHYQNGENFVSYDSVAVRGIHDLYAKNMERLLQGLKPVCMDKPWSIEHILAETFAIANINLILEKYKDDGLLAFRAGQIVGSGNDYKRLKDDFACMDNVYVFRAF